MITWAPWVRIVHIIGLWVCGFFSVALVLGTLVPAVLAAREGDVQGALVFGGLALGLLLLLGSRYRFSQAATMYAQSTPDGWQSEATHQPVESDNTGITSIVSPRTPNTFSIHCCPHA